MLETVNGARPAFEMLKFFTTVPPTFAEPNDNEEDDCR